MADVFERAIAAIAIKKIRRGREFDGRAVGSPGPAAGFAVFGVPFHVPSHKEIEMAVVIVIEEARGNRPAAARHACFFGDIGKGSVAIVVVQDIFSIARHEEVSKTIVIIVSDCHTHAVIARTCSRQACGFGDVGEAAVLVLAVEPVPIAGVGAIEFLRELHGTCQMAAVDQKDVEQAVVIVVEQGHTPGHGLDEVFFGSGRILQCEVQPAGEFQIKNRSGGSHS